MGTFASVTFVSFYPSRNMQQYESRDFLLVIFILINRRQAVTERERMVVTLDAGPTEHIHFEQAKRRNSCLKKWVSLQIDKVF